MSSLAIRRAAPANALTANVATAQVFNLASNSLLAVSLGAPGKLVLEQKQFRVRAEGNYYNAGAYTTKATLLANLTLPATPLTATNWTGQWSGTARAISGAGYSNWWIEANLIFDSNSGLLNGVFSQMVNNLFDTWAVIGTQITGINGTNLTIGGVAPTDPALYFGIALTFGTAAATNVGNLGNFEIGF